MSDEAQMPHPSEDQSAFLQSRAQTDKEYADELNALFGAFKHRMTSLVVSFVNDAIQSGSDGKLKARMHIATHVLGHMVGSLEGAALSLGVPEDAVLAFRKHTIEEGRGEPLLEKKKDEQSAPDR